MGSGKYGAISGAISRMQMQENISEHLANLKTPSYKKGIVAFKAQLDEASSGMLTKGINHTVLSEETIDFTPGQLEFSGDPLHLAINGDGFFQVERQDGSLAYTRKGNFKLNPLGVLTDSGGQPVVSAEGGQIILFHPDVEIAPDGSIFADGERIAKIALFKFTDNSILARAGGNMYTPVDGSQPEPHPEPQLVQKSLEASNVDMMTTMARMTSNLRAFEATQKALKIYNDMDSKASEIGQL